jgi:cyclopropane fatty-acyl-phospholipid synthase-like methyltransferase
MGIYVLMRILESSPGRYDRGLHILTMGRVSDAYDRLVEHVMRGDRVLDVGCGTGALSLRAAARGAQVLGIDVNAQMLEIARQRAQQAEFEDKVEFREMGVAELDSEKSGGYDVVMAGLCLSELTPDELSYALQQSLRILGPGGLLLLADEVVPDRIVERLVNAVVRFPLAILAYVWTQTTTHALRDLPQRVQGAGFTLESQRTSNLGSLMELVARKPAGPGK